MMSTGHGPAPSVPERSSRPSDSAYAPRQSWPCSRSHDSRRASLLPPGPQTRAHRGHQRRACCPGAQPGQEGLILNESPGAPAAGNEHDVGGGGRVVAAGRDHLNALAACDGSCSGTDELDGELVGNQAEQLHRPEHVQQLEPVEQHNGNAAQVTGHGFHPHRFFSTAPRAAGPAVSVSVAGDPDLGSRPSRSALTPPACGPDPVARHHSWPSDSPGHLGTDMGPAARRRRFRRHRPRTALGTARDVPDSKGAGVRRV